MGYIYAQGGSLGNSGGGVITPDEFEQQGAIYTGARPCFVWFRGDLYVIGYYTRPVVRQKGDSGRFRLAGIRPPQRYVSVNPGTGSGGSSGSCLAAITFVHKSGSRVLAESNFGNVVDVGDLAGEGRSWTNIDNVTGELRVSHVRGYVSMVGGDFRMAWEAPYGLTAYEENLRTAQLTFVGPDGWTHGVPPGTRFGHTWAGRMWYANAPNYPYRIWFSEPGWPQYVDPANFRDTWDREPITAIWKGRNELLVFCERATYMVRQFGQGTADFILEKLDSDVGCISHFGIQEIHNKLWFPGEDGIWIYDGSFRYLMKEALPLWKADWEANRAEFRDGFAMHDRINKCYEWVTRRTDREEFELTGLRPGTVTYVGYYGAFEPSVAGDQPHPEWTLDMKMRFDSSGFYNEEGELLIGSCDGVIRIQDWTNGDDDGDGLGKPAIIRRGHDLFNIPGDDWQGGKKLEQCWVYVESETTGWTLYIKSGDEQAWRSLLPDNALQNWKADVPASSLEETRAVRLMNGQQQTLTLGYVPLTVHAFVPQNVTGRGFTFEIRATSPIGLEYRGVGGLWSPGPGSTRQVEEKTNFTIALLWSSDGGTTWESFPIAGAAPAGAYGPVRVRAELTYLYGTPAYPIDVRFLVTTTAEDYDETVEIAAAPLQAIGGANPLDPWDLTCPSTGTVVVSAVDANGVVGQSETETIALTAA